MNDEPFPRVESKDSQYKRMDALYLAVANAIQADSGCSGMEIVVVLTRLLGDYVRGAPPELRNVTLTSIMQQLRAEVKA